MSHPRRHSGVRCWWFLARLPRLGWHPDPLLSCSLAADAQARFRLVHGGGPEVARRSLGGNFTGSVRLAIGEDLPQEGHRLLDLALLELARLGG